MLKKLYPDHIYVEMNPLDAEPLGIEAKQKVFIASRRGQVTATVFITNTVQPGQVLSRCIIRLQTNSLSRPLIRTHGSLPTKPALFP